MILILPHSDTLAGPFEDVSFSRQLAELDYEVKSVRASK